MNEWESSLSSCNDLGVFVQYVMKVYIMSFYHSLKYDKLGY